ncbi:MAG TPA: hypothetical protein VN455_10210 [Methanotrichaceae archaeon]|nr:hypothetical protein [Methanotrichaceae archaeon]
MMRIFNILGRLWLFGLAIWTLCLILSMGNAGTIWIFAYVIVLWDLLAAMGLFVLVKMLKVRSI